MTDRIKTVSTRTSRPRAPKPPKPMTSSQRKTLATKTIVNTLTVSDEVLAITAALEAISELLAWDTDLRETVRQKYDAMQALKPVKQEKEDFGPMPPLVRTPGLNRQTSVYVVDPYELALDYGRDQLRNVIRRASLPNLRVAVNLVKERNPGKKPSGTAKAALIDFIVTYVAGSGY